MISNSFSGAFALSPASWGPKSASPETAGRGPSARSRAAKPEQSAFSAVLGSDCSPLAAWKGPRMGLDPRIRPQILEFLYLFLRSIFDILPWLRSPGKKGQKVPPIFVCSWSEKAPNAPSPWPFGARFWVPRPDFFFLGGAGGKSLHWSTPAQEDMVSIDDQTPKGAVFGGPP